MSSLRRPASGLSVAVGLPDVVAAVGGWPARSAQASKIRNHERVTRDPLAPLGVDPTGLGQILVGPPPGAGAVGSDAFFADDFRHIDNAKAPAADAGERARRQPVPSRPTSSLLVREDDNACPT